MQRFESFICFEVRYADCSYSVASLTNVNVEEISGTTFVYSVQVEATATSHYVNWFIIYLKCVQNQFYEPLKLCFWVCYHAPDWAHHPCNHWCHKCAKITSSHASIDAVNNRPLTDADDVHEAVHAVADLEEQVLTLPAS